jgi:ketosteroid isomerase-like protein
MPLRVTARMVEGQVAGLVRTPPGKVRPVSQREVYVSEVDDFLETVLPRQLAAERALVNGDAGPRRAFWSEREPVTILGAARDALNKQEVAEAFDWLEKLLSNGEGDLEVVAAGASGDMGYIVGYERTAASVAGEPQPGFELRVTLIFRREDGEWRAVHRHADPRVQGQAAVERARELAHQ